MVSEPLECSTIRFFQFFSLLEPSMHIERYSVSAKEVLKKIPGLPKSSGASRPGAIFVWQIQLMTHNMRTYF